MDSVRTCPEIAGIAPGQAVFADPLEIEIPNVTLMEHLILITFQYCQHETGGCTKEMRKATDQTKPKQTLALGGC